MELSIKGKARLEENSEYKRRQRPPKEAQLPEQRSESRCGQEREQKTNEGSAIHPAVFNESRKPVKSASPISALLVSRAIYPAMANMK